MTKRMLIDAAHREETRVVVADGTQIDDFDFESEAKKQIKGNIYLARVTRVEPSLQAAFVEYGGNRHGFLAFSEIHPDYYQIPVADRERLLALEAEAEAKRAAAEAARDDAEEAAHASDDAEDTRAEDEDEEENDADDEAVSAADEDHGEDADAGDDGKLATMASTPAKVLEGDEVVPEGEADLEDDAEAGHEDDDEEDDDYLDLGDEAEVYAAEIDDEDDDGEEDGAEAKSDDTEDGEVADGDRGSRRGRHGGRRRQARGGRGTARSGGTGNGRSGGRGNGRRRSRSEDDDEDLNRDPRPYSKSYKIQEVIRRRQVLLVQVAKEERGNKGAALTTYLSLPGRYCVLMPNTARGGGISRKITNMSDRRRLKAIVAELDVPKGMGLIVRTAGANRTKAEIKRDYDYLIRLWGEIRELTLKSSAPSLIYEEGNLIKRSIRDLYSKDIDEVLIEGKDAYTEAKAFMKMLMPSHARNVKLYTERMPLFQRYHVDVQMDAMLSPRVDLPSGGYIIINQTEALVSVDVNSGRSTREHNIEQTALKTNLEAAEELARQLRLRDLAGLIVIDFIDMEENRNNRSVERKLKDCLEQDRARLQVGRISNFGLLEMSRQRLRAGILEGSTRPCPHCDGAGIVRSVESAALRILRACGEEAVRERSASITVRTNRETAEFILNFKRRQLIEFEDMYGMTTVVAVDPQLNGDEFEVDRGEPLSESRRRELHESESVSLDTAYMAEEDEEDEVVTDETEEDESEEVSAVADPADETKSVGAADADADADADKDLDEDGKPRRRRRGRRGGKRNRRRRERQDGEDVSADANGADGGAEGDESEAEVRNPSTDASDKPRRPRRRRGGGRQSTADETRAEENGSTGSGARALEPVGASQSDDPASGTAQADDGDAGKKGWWQKRWFN